jgi:hypothetical protein
MAEVSLEVPGELVGRVRESVLLLYEASAEALHLALRAHAEGHGTIDEVDRHRAHVARLDGLLDQLDEDARSPVSVCAPAEILHDALYGALIDAGERLAAECDASWRADRSLEDVGGAARWVIALDALLRRVGG